MGNNKKKVARKRLPRIEEGPRGRFDCSGGQIHTSRGAEAPFGNTLVSEVRLATNCPTSWNIKPPSAYINARTGRYAPTSVQSTPNHRLLLWAGYLGAAHRDGNAAQRRESIEGLAEIYRLQLTSGHMLSEECTTSHYPQHFTGVMGSRFLARIYDIPEITELTSQWCCRELYLNNLIVVSADGELVDSKRSGHSITPGARPSGNNRELRTVGRCLMMGVPAPARLGFPDRPITGNPNKNGPFYTDVVHVGANWLRNLIADGDDIGGAAGPNHRIEMPILRNELDVYEDGENYLMLFKEAGPKVGPRFMFWTARVNGVTINSPERGGQITNRIRNPFPLPPEVQAFMISGARHIVVPGTN